MIGFLECTHTDIVDGSLVEQLGNALEQQLKVSTEVAMQ